MVRQRVGWLGLALFTLFVSSARTGASELQKFTVSDAERQGLLGFAATVSGNMGFVGAPAGTSNSGRGYLFDVVTGTRQHTLFPSVANDKDMFGFNAKMSGDRLLIGDPGNPSRGTPAGAAYVFDVDTGVELMRVQPNDSFAGNEFGFGINMNDDLAIIGAPNLGQGPGAAYLFDVDTGRQLKRLVAEDAFDGAEFGFDVAVNDNYAVVGSPGNFDALGFTPGFAYVFDVNSGRQLFKLVPDDSFGGNEFGFDVAVFDDLAVVGAPDGGSGRGAAYLFDLKTGQQLQKLTPENSAVGDNFGGSVDIRESVVAIGASGLNNVLGSVYVFDAASGRQLDKLFPTDIEDGDNFGTSVSISDHRLLVGSPGDDDTTLNAGAAYLFDLPLPGDFNNNDQLDAQDIDLLTEAVKSRLHPAQFDLNDDGLVDQTDRAVWVNEIANTFFGDANLDRQFNSSDLILILQAGEYEDDVHGNSLWSGGDFNGDCDFDSADLIAALQSGAYEQGPRAATQAVPEPAGLSLALISLLLISIRRGRAKGQPERL